MSQWAIYTPSGRIDRVYSGIKAEALVQPQGSEQAAIMPDGLDDTTAYVSGGQVVPKQTMPLQTSNPQITADGADECVIGNIPEGTTVQWPDGQTDEVTDGEVRFSVDLADTYKLKFSAIAYLDQEVTIEAVIPA
ncbi:MULTISPECIES: hypothetical protein [unclassified Marinobacter]|uniref:hypothetical protein n=1 Tax=unclassified Marinobacter TaxID=83889 RepID=UPI0019266A7D|nr:MULTISPECIES: hypothetical protein [unclassified Marinobacter]MBL3825168.1 hypothetical protein [Marinobacter sp. MC3]MBL3893628.1 hypothetical protein [Marinobacter sp. MW3]